MHQLSDVHKHDHHLDYEMRLRHVDRFLASLGHGNPSLHRDVLHVLRDAFLPMPRASHVPPAQVRGPRVWFAHG